MDGKKWLFSNLLWIAEFESESDGYAEVIMKRFTIDLAASILQTGVYIEYK